MLSLADSKARSTITARAAVGMLAILAICDLLLPHVTVSIFYAIPLVMLVKTGHARPLWRSALIFMLLSYGLYFAKYTLWPPEVGPRYFDYRLVNRTFVAVMLGLLGVFVEMWRESEVEREEFAYEGSPNPLDTEGKRPLPSSFAFHWQWFLPWRIFVYLGILTLRYSTRCRN